MDRATLTPSRWATLIGLRSSREIGPISNRDQQGGPTARELIHALMACIWWWDTQPAMVRSIEEPEAFVRGRALVARALAA